MTWQALERCEKLTAVSVLLSSVELLWIAREMRDTGLLSWRIHRMSMPQMMPFLRWTGVDAMLRYPNVYVLLILRLAAAVWVLVCPAAHVSRILGLAVAALVTWVLRMRSSATLDGADNMNLLVLVAALIGEVVGTPVGRGMALLFVAAQAGLAYVTAGALKLREAGWQSGAYVSEILKTSSYGSARISWIYERLPRARRISGLAVGAVDCSLGLCVLLPPAGCLILLGCGVVFHASLAVVMGLNTFPWAFAATYPATFWASTLIHAGTVSPAHLRALAR